MLRTCAVLAIALTLASACDGKDKNPNPVSPSTPPNPNPPNPPNAPTAFVVIDESGRLAADHELFVNTDRGRTDWVSVTPDGLQLAYPSGQVWGFIAGVLVGNPTPGSRPGRDLSAFKTLQLQLRGAVGGETLEVGIKDNTDPDSGIETKKAVVLTTEWKTFTFPLTDFSTADRTRLYVVFELVFNGSSARTIVVRDVRYVP